MDIRGLSMNHERTFGQEQMIWRLTIKGQKAECEMSAHVEGHPTLSPTVETQTPWSAADCGYCSRRAAVP